MSQRSFRSRTASHQWVVIWKRVFLSGWPELNANKPKQFSTDSLALTWTSAASAGCAGREHVREKPRMLSHTRETKHIISYTHIYVRVTATNANANS